MKAYVKCEASDLLLVRVPLCSSASFPFSHFYPRQVYLERARSRRSGLRCSWRCRESGWTRAQAPRGLDGTSLRNRSCVFKKHLSLWKQSCQAIFSFTIFTAVSLSYANEAADEGFLQGGPCWDQLYRGIYCLPRSPDRIWDEETWWRWLPEQTPCPGSHGFLPDKPPGPASIPGVPWSFISKDSSVSLAWLSLCPQFLNSWNPLKTELPVASRT